MSAAISAFYGGEVARVSGNKLTCNLNLRFCTLVELSSGNNFIEVKNNTIDGINQNGIIIQTVDAENVLIEDNIIDGYINSGIKAIEVKELIIRGNRVLNMVQYSVEIGGENVTFDNNVIGDSGAHH